MERGVERCDYQEESTSWFMNIIMNIISIMTSGWRGEGNPLRVIVIKILILLINIVDSLIIIIMILILVSKFSLSSS